MYFYRGVCKKTAQNSIFRMMFSLNFRRVKNSYLIRPLSKNLIFFCGDVIFFVLNMSAKNREKVQPLGHFFGLTFGKNCDFSWFG